MDHQDSGSCLDGESLVSVLLGIAILAEILVVSVQDLALTELLDALLESVVVGDVEG